MSEKFVTPLNAEQNSGFPIFNTTSKPLHFNELASSILRSHSSHKVIEVEILVLSHVFYVTEVIRKLVNGAAGDLERHNDGGISCGNP